MDLCVFPRRGMLFRIFRLAEKKEAQCGEERIFAQFINAPRNRLRWSGAGVRSNRSEGAQEFEQFFLLVGFEFFKLLGDVFGFASMTEDGVEQGDGGAIVHEP
jgi:hypothetical protein